MALRSPSSTPRLDLASRDSPPTDSPPPASQGGSSNGAKAEVGTKTKDGLNRLLAKLEKEGLEIDDKIASIINDGIARIKAEAVRENISEPKRDWISVLDTIAWITVGFMMGVKWYEHAFRAANGIDKTCPPRGIGQSNSLGLVGTLCLLCTKPSR